MINLNNKKFKTISNTANGELTTGFVFHYKQQHNIVSCLYDGGEIVKGQLLGIVSKKNTIDIRYQQINKKSELKTGMCQSTIMIQENGKIRIEENWQWITGAISKGFSILEECE